MDHERELIRNQVERLQAELKRLWRQPLGCSNNSSSDQELQLIDVLDRIEELQFVDNVAVTGIYLSPDDIKLIADQLGRDSPPTGAVARYGDLRILTIEQMNALESHDSVGSYSGIHYGYHPVSRNREQQLNGILDRIVELLVSRNRIPLDISLGADDIQLVSSHLEPDVPPTGATGRWNGVPVFTDEQIRPGEGALLTGTYAGIPYRYVQMDIVN